jgi:hypothetical protein
MAQHFSTRGPASRRIPRGLGWSARGWAAGSLADAGRENSDTQLWAWANQYTVNLRLAKTIGFGPAKLTSQGLRP